MTDLYKSACLESGTELGFKLTRGGGGWGGVGGQSSLFKNFKKLEY